jgi:hypothetical protein
MNLLRLTRPTVRLLAAAALVAAAGCCANGKCIKEPPCRPCENPCCLTPVQKAALGKSQHALVSPEAWIYEEKTYVLLTEKGAESFHKDPTVFDEKDAVRRTKAGKTIYVDFEPGKDVDLTPYAMRARPYVPKPKPPAAP